MLKALFKLDQSLYTGTLQPSTVLLNMLKWVTVCEQNFAKLIHQAKRNTRNLYYFLRFQVP